MPAESETKTLFIGGHWDGQEYTLPDDVQGWRVPVPSGIPWYKLTVDEIPYTNMTEDVYDRCHCHLVRPHMVWRQRLYR